MGPVMQRATTRPAGFIKPANWNNDPPPAPGPGSDTEKRGPTRYGDWVNKGIVAVDF